MMSCFWYCPEKEILIDVLLSSTSGLAFNAGRSIWLPGWLNAVCYSNSLFWTIGPGDWLVHHAIALGLHTTNYMDLSKRCFRCQINAGEKGLIKVIVFLGPGRGGTCYISAWDTFYLAVFWLLIKYHWLDGLLLIGTGSTSHTLWQGNVSLFHSSSTYLLAGMVKRFSMVKLFTTSQWISNPYWYE